MKSATRDVHDCSLRLCHVLDLCEPAPPGRFLLHPGHQPVAQGNKLGLMRTALPVAQAVDTPDGTSLRLKAVTVRSDLPRGEEIRHQRHAQAALCHFEREEIVRIH